MKESKAMMKKEVSFMKKKGAPKSMIKHEMKEAGMKKMASGGITLKPPKFMDEGPVQQRNTRLAGGGKVGGSYRKAADGIASKGKTKGKMVKMRYGGAC